MEIPFIQQRKRMRCIEGNAPFCTENRQIAGSLPEAWFVSPAQRVKNMLADSWMDSICIYIWEL